MECDDVFDPIPEVCTRLARIRTEQGKTDDAIELYQTAKDVLGIRIKYNAFFGNLNIMKWLIDDLYELKPFNYDNVDLYDLYYLLKYPHEIRMYDAPGDETSFVELKSVQEGDICEVCFNDKWFHDRDDFFANAEYAGVMVKSSYGLYWKIEVMQ